MKLNIFSMVGMHGGINSCYQNAALQAISSISVIQKYFYKIYKGNEGGVVSELYNHCIGKGNRSTLLSLMFKHDQEMKKYMRGQQMDSSEFLIDVITLYLKEVPKMKKYLNVTEEKKFTCTRCGNSFSNKTESPFIFLHVGNHSDVYNLVNDYQSEEVVDYKCARCKSNQNHIAKATIIDSPKTLIFIVKKYNNGLNKINFYEHIKLFNTHYKLTSFIVHSGNLYGGHYVACVKKDKWYLANDGHVSQINNPDLSSGYVYVYKKLNLKHIGLKI